MRKWNNLKRNIGLGEPTAEEILTSGNVNPEKRHILYNALLDDRENKDVLRFLAEEEYNEIARGNPKRECSFLLCQGCILFMPEKAKKCGSCGKKDYLKKIPEAKAVNPIYGSELKTKSMVINKEDMVLIQHGVFMMGSPEAEEGRNSDERQHEVTITRDFYLGRFLVTQKIWKEVMGGNPSQFKGDDLPIENVSWYDSIVFCNVLSMIENMRPAYMKRGKQITRDYQANGYRLPTEAEWEYACRAGSTTRFNTGDSDGNMSGAGWYSGNADSKTHPGGKGAPNDWGLNDMHGNVWEWCWDWKAVYISGSVTDPTGPSSGSARVIRGGSWDFGAGYCRSAVRIYYKPGYCRSDVGLRLLRPINP